MFLLLVPTLLLLLLIALKGVSKSRSTSKSEINILNNFTNARKQ